MRLLSLKLQNFRQHRNTDIQFFEGITGILGRNGSGKSTLLEGIAWALYGQKAVQRMERGKVDTIRSRGASIGEVPEAQLIFTCSGQQYKVVRRTNDAAFFLSGSKIHTGTEDVTKAVSSLLGMDIQAFFTSFFTSQKDLAFLRDISGQGRQKYIGRLLGYDRLTRARELANTEKIALRRDMETLSQGLGDLDDIRKRKMEAASAVETAKTWLARAKLEVQKAKKLLADVEPRKLTSEAQERQWNALSKDIAVFESQYSLLDEQIKRIESDAAEIDEADRDMKVLEPLVVEYEALKSKRDTMIELRDAEAKRQILQNQLLTEEAELKRLKMRTSELTNTSGDLKELTAKIQCLEKLQRDSRKEMETAERVWIGKKSELSAEHRTAQTRIGELEGHLKQLESAGPEGICPTCERPLGSEFSKVTEDMREQIAGLFAKIATIDAMLKSLDLPPIDVATAKALVENYELDMNATKLKQYEARAAFKALEEEMGRMTEIEDRVIGIRDCISTIPKGFDSVAFDKLILRGKELKPTIERARDLSSKLSRRKRVSDELVALNENMRGVIKALEEKRALRTSLEFDPGQHQGILQQWKLACEHNQTSRDQYANADAAVQVAEVTMKERELEEQRHNDRLKSLKSKKENMRHIEYLVTTFDQFREVLNAEITPRLSESASELISVITDGRYNQINLDEDYTPRLFDDGEGKPVISGGEEDAVHITMRLAISQMIAERAGTDLGLLIMDEVFTSLDETRRQNVINLLQNLKGRFQQILLITHIESIHDMVDRAIWVDYDSAMGSSRVRDARDASIALSEPLLQ